MQPKAKETQVEAGTCTEDASIELLHKSVQYEQLETDYTKPSAVDQPVIDISSLRNEFESLVSKKLAEEQTIQRQKEAKQLLHAIEMLKAEIKALEEEKQSLSASIADHDTDLLETMMQLEKQKAQLKQDLVVQPPKSIQDEYVSKYQSEYKYKVPEKPILNFEPPKDLQPLQSIVQAKKAAPETPTPSTRKVEAIQLIDVQEQPKEKGKPLLPLEVSKAALVTTKESIPVVPDVKLAVLNRADLVEQPKVVAPVVNLPVVVPSIPKMDSIIEPKPAEKPKETKPIPPSVPPKHVDKPKDQPIVHVQQPKPTYSNADIDTVTQVIFDTIVKNTIDKTSTIMSKKKKLYNANKPPEVYSIAQSAEHAVNYASALLERAKMLHCTTINLEEPLSVIPLQVFFDLEKTLRNTDDQQVFNHLVFDAVNQYIIKFNDLVEKHKSSALLKGHIFGRKQHSIKHKQELKLVDYVHHQLQASSSCANNASFQDFALMEMIEKVAIQQLKQLPATFDTWNAVQEEEQIKHEISESLFDTLVCDTISELNRLERVRLATRQPQTVLV